LLKLQNPYQIGGIHAPHFVESWQPFQQGIISRHEIIASPLDSACYVQCILASDPYILKFASHRKNLWRFGNHNHSLILPALNQSSPFLEGIMGVLIVKDIGPYQIDFPFQNLLLYEELCLSFKFNPNLGLIVKGTVETAVVEIDSHGQIPVKITSRRVFMEASGKSVGARCPTIERSS
jgi:hypothetical protein